MPRVAQLGRGWAGIPGMSVACWLAALWVGEEQENRKGRKKKHRDPFWSVNFLYDLARSRSRKQGAP